MEIENILIWCVIGLVAGWLASLVLGGGGLIRYLVSGLIGAFVGGFLFNLLGNAVKYGGEEPGIRVELRRSGGGLAIAVVDQGPGIPREEQGRILLPFERGADALESRKPGAGLGLAIVNAIVSSQGGRLSLKSEPGQGCRFEVWLPGAKE